MSTAMKRFIEKLGALLTSYLYAVGMTLMFIHAEGAAPSTGYVLGYTALAVLVLLVMGLSKKSIWLTLTALAAAAIACLLSGWKPISGLRRFISDVENGNILNYIDQLSLAVSIVLLLIAYSLARDRHGVYVMIALAFIVSLVCWFVGVRIRVEYLFMPLIAVSAQFSVSGVIRQSNIKALLSASLIAALLATWIVPGNGAVYEPLERASEKVVRSVIEFFNLDRNNVEERRTFNLISYGWRTLYDAFGGPASPSTQEIMRVETNKTLYLRGSIRYTYDNKGWVDETNSNKAGKIKRYMTTGLEGRIYRDEFENAFDLDKESVLENYFEPQSANVEILTDSLYWSIYTPGRTNDILSDSLRVYYNNLGEVFASQQLSAGDSYTVNYYSLQDGVDLSSAVQSSKGGSDRAYQAARLLNRDVPNGIDNRLFELVRQIISGKTSEYEMAQAICDYLRTNGTYTLNARYVPQGRDFVSYFVLSDMYGYCMHFAAAMTLMSRIAGLPARYVEGYLCTPDETGACTVTGLDAHAWSEVYFDGFGWVTFEATPAEGNNNPSGSGNDVSSSEPETGNDGSSLSDQGSDGVPEPTPTPAPTQTPAPTPSPTPNNWQEPEESEDWPDDQTQEEHTEPEEEPEDQNQEESDQDSGEEENPESGNEDPEPPEDDWNQPPQAENDTHSIGESASKEGHGLWLLILLAAALLLGAIFLCRWRLRQSEPKIASKRYERPEDKVLIWYKACLVALGAQGLRFSEGYTPASFAEKAISMGLADRRFADFSKELSGIRYSGRMKKEYDFENASGSYRAIVEKMKLKYRLRWYAYRIKNTLGSIEQVP